MGTATCSAPRSGDRGRARRRGGARASGFEPRGSAERARLREALRGGRRNDLRYRHAGSAGARWPIPPRSWRHARQRAGAPAHSHGRLRHNRAERRRNDHAVVQQLERRADVGQQAAAHRCPQRGAGIRGLSHLRLRRDRRAGAQVLSRCGAHVDQRRHGHGWHRRRRGFRGVVVIGEPPYAEFSGDRSDLSLAPEDLQAIQNVRKAGIPVVVVLISGAR